MSMKPMLFNTDMVRVLLDDWKTVTRRVVKPQPFEVHQHKTNSYCYVHSFANGEFCVNTSPYRPGDILYVRETWGFDKHNWLYRADFSAEDLEKLKNLLRWLPSIHMPKEAARIFLRVTNVRVERLQDIDDEQAKAEGSNWKNGRNVGWQEKMRRSAIDRFAEIWDSTIKKSDLPLYGWEANPWVWVIEFERISREEATR